MIARLLNGQAASGALTMAELKPSDKYVLTIKEAAEYSNIGERTIRDVIKNNPDCDFVLHKQSHVLIKRKQFETWIDVIRAI